MVAWMVLQVFQKRGRRMITVAILIIPICGFLIGFSVGTIKWIREGGGGKMNRNTTEYEKDLNELKEQILKDGSTLISKKDLLERFCEMDEEYNGHPWNLLQILANINILIGEEPCEKAVSVQDCINAIENTDCELSPQAWKEITASIMSLPPVTPTRKKGKWIKNR